MNIIRKFTAGIIAAAMALSLLPAFTLTAGAADAVTISTAAELKTFADRVNSGETDLNATLTADIDLSEVCSEESGISWTPIGNTDNKFIGTFDGNGHKITGLYINAPDSDYQGLFGHVGYNGTGTVKNLGVVDGSVTGGSYVGGVAGYILNGGTITNCYNTGTVSGNGDYVGGIVGLHSRSTVTNCYNTGSVSGNSKYVGGVVGYINGDGATRYGGPAITTVTNCYNTGSVSGNGNYVGGVAGYNFGGGSSIAVYGKMTNCYNTGTVSGSSNVGGVVGYNSYGEVTSCYYLDSCGAGGTYGTSKTTADFADKDTFTDWDFTTIWKIDSTLGRPILQSIPEEVIEEEPEVKGSGTESDPYLIPDLRTLEWFRNKVNDGNTGIYGKLTADIDMSDKYSSSTGESWTPIGDNNFNGIFDGGNHTITGLYINSTTHYQGLFGYVGENGTVKNVNIVDGDVTGREYVGGVAGANYGTVMNCYNTGTVSGSMYAGGVVGYNRNNGVVTNCYNTGTVSGSSTYAGGVVGLNRNGTVTNCYNTGSVSGRMYAGGVVGYSSESVVTNCYNTGSVSGSSSYAGGVVGSNSNGVVTNCYNTGSVTGSSVGYVGGVVGYNSGSSNVINCYNTGSVTGSSVGGVVGYGYSSSGGDNNITNCYNTGSVSGSNRYAGGVVGYNRNSVVTNCYYLDSCGADDTYGTSKTEAEFNSGSVAWLLQNGQDAQVWGQDITSADKDKYPLLTSDSGKKVVKATFNMQSGTESIEKYTNYGHPVSTDGLPKGKMTYNDEDFNADIPVNGDITVYIYDVATFVHQAEYRKVSETEADMRFLAAPIYTDENAVSNKYGYWFINMDDISITKYEVEGTEALYSGDTFYYTFMGIGKDNSETITEVGFYAIPWVTVNGNTAAGGAFTYKGDISAIEAGQVDKDGTIDVITD